MSDHAHTLMRICNTNLPVDSHIFISIIEDVIKNDLKNDFLALSDFYDKTSTSKSHNIILFRSTWHKMIFSEKLENNLEEKTSIKNIKI